MDESPLSSVLLSSEPCAQTRGPCESLATPTLLVPRKDDAEAARLSDPLRGSRMPSELAAVPSDSCGCEPEGATTSTGRIPRSAGTGDEPTLTLRTRPPSWRALRPRSCVENPTAELPGEGLGPDDLDDGGRGAALRGRRFAVVAGRVRVPGSPAIVAAYADWARCRRSAGTATSLCLAEGVGGKPPSSPAELAPELSRDAPIHTFACELTVWLVGEVATRLPRGEAFAVGDPPPARSDSRWGEMGTGGGTLRPGLRSSCAACDVRRGAALLGRRW